MSSTRTNSSSFFLGALAALVVALVAAMGALLLLAYNANPAQAAGSCSTTSGTTTCTYGSTGAEDTFVVPKGVSSVQVVATGAPGAKGGISVLFPGGSPAPGGRGAVVSGDLTGLTTGDTLYVNVGGAPTGAGSASCYPGRPDPKAVDCIGGFNGGNGGGSGGAGSGSLFGGGGGGGASDVRYVSRDRSGSLASRLIVAAGGGGGGVGGMCIPPLPPQFLLGGAGGAAGSELGGLNGKPCVLDGGGYRIDGGKGGKAGTQSAGGAGGAGGTVTDGGSGLAGQSGLLGQGGLGGRLGGGGGGGGLFGGGGGGGSISCPDTEDCNTLSASGAGGGGGGSNLVPQGGSATLTQDTTVAPSVTISYRTGGVGEPPPPTEQPQTKEECKKGGYEEFGFKNQGRCIKAVNHPS
jgi:hypothetical protein